MKLSKGFLKMLHGFRYSDDAPFDVKAAVIESQLKEIKQMGYDGVVANADNDNGYIKNEENWLLMEEKARVCSQLGLRLWIYDEKGYPSGAAGVITLNDDPSLEALALAAVHKVLLPGESAFVPLPHGHLKAIGAFGFYFEGDTVTQTALTGTPLRPPVTDNGFYFENSSDKKLFCLCFFTKPAFEGTHCQHNAFSERRYIDIGNPKAGKAFVENTYKPYCQRLEKYFKNGTIEAFFADEPSYMAVYFNLKGRPRSINHFADPLTPLYAMVNWSCELPEKFFEKYGYRLEDNLPWLFIGSLKEHRQVRSDFHMLLTELAQKNFFKPIADFCEAQGTRSSGHILLEEKITDHTRYQGSFFPLLKTMHVPGMDMLDSLPERVWKKAFTPLLVSSISLIHRDGCVMNEVSAHFQNKFSVKVSPQQRFNAIVLQYALGANIFTSYYSDADLLKKLPSEETVLSAVKKVMSLTQLRSMPRVAVHYPIEAVMANSASPVDIAKVYDSILNEYIVPYPIDRRDLDKTHNLTPLVEDSSDKTAKSIEKSMEDVMYTLLDRQVEFVFCDTESVDKLLESSPELFIIPAQSPTAELLDKLNTLSEAGCKVIVLTDNGSLRDEYKRAANVTLLDSTHELIPLLESGNYIKTQGDTSGIAALWNENKLLLVNTQDQERSLTLELSARNITDCYLDNNVPLSCENGKTKLSLSPYGVYIIEF